MNTFHQNSYELLDSGNGRKLERFGPYVISRPSAQAVWQPKLPQSTWSKAHGIFSRETDEKWEKKALPDQWSIDVDGILFKISPTDFGHLGIFPEQRDSWKWIRDQVSKASREVKVLNLFAYSGGSTMSPAKAGAQVCHLDASKGMVTWARDNAELNGLDKAPIRWIIDDVTKFLAREIKRGVRYEGIILDPPSFGRGSKGETFKIERDLPEILKMCKELLSPNPLFILFSCHTPGFSPVVMKHLLEQLMADRKGRIEEGEMVLRGGENVFELPSGTYARWINEQ